MLGMHGNGVLIKGWRVIQQFFRESFFQMTFAEFQTDFPTIAVPNERSPSFFCALPESLSEMFRLFSL
jgi:hypothetical protein